MPAKPNKRLCLLCGKRPPQRATSAICSWCFGAIEARGEKWCNAGRHVVSRDGFGEGACHECKRIGAKVIRERAKARAATASTTTQPTQTTTPGRCGICGASLAGHARCAGCTRLYHGPLPQPELCWLCARDRAKGVPPKGYGLREVAA